MQQKIDSFFSPPLVPGGPGGGGRCKSSERSEFIYVLASRNSYWKICTVCN